MPKRKPYAEPIDRLTDAQIEALRLVARGLEHKQIARELGISFDALRERLREARRILEVGRTSEAADLVFRSEAARGTDYTKDVATPHVVVEKPESPLPSLQPNEGEVHENQAIFGVSPTGQPGRFIYQSREIARFLRSPVGVVLMVIAATAGLAVAMSAVVQMVALLSELVSPTR